MSPECFEREMRGNKQRCQSSAFDLRRAPSRISSTDRTARFLLGCQCQYNSGRILSRKRSVNSSFVSYKVADLLLFFRCSPWRNLPCGMEFPSPCAFCFTSSVKTHSFHRSQVGDVRWYNVEHYLWRIDLSVLWKHSKMLLSMTHRREGKKKEKTKGTFILSTDEWKLLLHQRRTSIRSNSCADGEINQARRPVPFFPFFFLLWWIGRLIHWLWWESPSSPSTFRRSSLTSHTYSSLSMLLCSFTKKMSFFLYGHWLGWSDRFLRP